MIVNLASKGERRTNSLNRFVKNPIENASNGAAALDMYSVTTRASSGPPVAPRILEVMTWVLYRLLDLLHVPQSHEHVHEGRQKGIFLPMPQRLNRPMTARKLSTC